MDSSRPFPPRNLILAWVLGDHSAETFQPLWDILYLWKCYFYVTYGWK
ncbi:Mobile element protein [Richelia intracellularis]|nr:Mobile element protein [Richelia intracellularis]